MLNSQNKGNLKSRIRLHRLSGFHCIKQDSAGLHAARCHSVLFRTFGPADAPGEMGLPYFAMLYGSAFQQSGFVKIG
jgi:hypothetical protein